MEKVVVTNRSGLKLSVRLTLSPNATKLVFLEHGRGARKEYPHMVVMEELFAKNGYNVVNIDASNSLNESESSPDGITFTSHYNDLEDIIAWAKAQSFYVEPFALAGQSLGAIASALFAASYPQKVNLLVLASLPWFNGKEAENNKVMQDAIDKEGFFDQVSKSTGRVLRIQRKYFEDKKQYDLTPLIKNITADTFLVVGTLDAELHINNNRKHLNCLEAKRNLCFWITFRMTLPIHLKQKQLFQKQLVIF